MWHDDEREHIGRMAAALDDELAMPIRPDEMKDAKADALRLRHNLDRHSEAMRRLADR